MDAGPFLPEGGEGNTTRLPQYQLLDFFFPGFTVFSTAASKYLHIDLNLYIPLILLFGGLTFIWRYFADYFSDMAESHLMSRVDIRIDDETFNYVMAWVSTQRFAQGARRFVVNTNLNSRSWYLWRSFYDDDEDLDDGDDVAAVERKKKKALAYTPTFGSHWFLYKGRILIFRRSQNQQQSPFMTASEREEISISCFGRNPWILKELLHEARDAYLKKDEAKTAIYRGTTKSGSSEPQWQRCMSRTSRPFSTVILNDEVKKSLIDDVTDYLNPATRRWYANRGIPYRRGYLLHGPPGTGKSSLSLALAGFFKMRIYIVSLSSVTANEENLATLFAELPRRCVVLLEDIDTAGLTHTRDDAAQTNVADSTDNSNDTTTEPRAPGARGNPNQNTTGRLSLSGLLNILDGVASQEGRVLIMTTNHIEKLDKALIRPGRVDMIVKFDRADASMTAQIFRAIYAPLEADEAPSPSAPSSDTASSTSNAFWPLERGIQSAMPRLTPEEETKRNAAAAEAARKKDETMARVNELAEQFAARIPAHEFSPAEIQGFLLKNKRDPEKAVAGAEDWVIATRKEKKEKELKEAEEKRAKEEKEKKEREEKEKKKEKEEKEKKSKKDKGSKKKKAGKTSKKSKKGAESGSEESDSESSPSSDESETSASEREKEKSRRKRKPAASAASTPIPTSSPAADDASPLAELKEEGESEPKKDEPIVVVPSIAIDTVKAKEATAAEGPQRTPGADSGYGTPS
ncbi:putative mitochondrial chaperone BCS1-B [Corynascus novoguineensis]|uniref:Mitochondrial chaperone BCS1-B n=1 Tax=Corynascus novoguineensis TaxID=1126955 RepID=A0AAN7D379_9PEZI|nr:putative mitochondrial chaperone BCS1-B [Corynascus novoguineensis]